jgi:hypothetical protein
MPKRASVPQGKALFFRSPEPAMSEETAEIAVVEAPVRAEHVERTEVPDRVERAERAERAERIERATAERSVGTTKSPTRQSAIFLEEQHIDWLEDRCREARRNGGRAIRKAAIIRALLDVAMDGGIDLTGLKREDDLAERIRDSLRG